MNASKSVLGLAIVLGLVGTSGAAQAIPLPDVNSPCSTTSSNGCLKITNGNINGVAVFKASTFSTNTQSIAVNAHSEHGIAVFARTVFGTPDGAAVHGETINKDASGVRGKNFTSGGLTQNAAAVFGTSNFNTVDVWAGRFDGDVVASSYHLQSDARLKKDIKELRHGLNAVLELHPVTYKMKHDTTGNRTEIGFLAQEVEKLIPEVVMSRGPDEMRVLNYTALLPVAINAIQEQQQLINRQQARIASLEKSQPTALASMFSGATGMLLSGFVLGLSLLWQKRRRQESE